VGNKNTWHNPTSTAEAIARARGRARYNSKRHLEAVVRRAAVLHLYLKFGGERGAQSRIAKILGVDRSTVCRDLRVAISVNSHPCPTCKTRISIAKWKRLGKEGAINRGLDPRSVAGQAEILAADVVNELVPRLLADLGFFVSDDGHLEHEDGEPLPDSAPTLGDVVARAQEALKGRRAA